MTGAPAFVQDCETRALSPLTRWHMACLKRLWWTEEDPGPPPDGAGPDDHALATAIGTLPPGRTRPADRDAIEPLLIAAARAAGGGLPDRTPAPAPRPPRARPAPEPAPDFDPLPGGGYWLETA